MVLDHIGVALTDQFTQIAYQPGFVLWPSRLQRGSQPAIITQRNHKNTPAMRVERGRFEVDLHSVEFFVVYVAEVDLARLHKILLNGANCIIFIQLAESAD